MNSHEERALEERLVKRLASRLTVALNSTVANTINTKLQPLEARVSKLRAPDTAPVVSLEDAIVKRVTADLLPTMTKNSIAITELAERIGNLEARVLALEEPEAERYTLTRTKLIRAMKKLGIT